MRKLWKCSFKNWVNHLNCYFAGVKKVFWGLFSQKTNIILAEFAKNSSVEVGLTSYGWLIYARSLIKLICLGRDGMNGHDGMNPVLY